MIDAISRHQKDIVDICRRLKVKRLELFGSAARGEYDQGRSDLDFLVEFEAPESPPGLLCRYLSLAEELETLLGEKVDLITPRSIRNPYFQKSVDASRETVYAG